MVNIFIEVEVSQLSENSDNNRLHKADIVLVSAPFSPLQTPSLGLGLLHGQMNRMGISCVTLNFAIDFANLVGSHIYDLISDGYPARTDLVGDWLFNNTLFDTSSDEDEHFINEIVRGQHRSHRASRDGAKNIDESFVTQLRVMREHAHPFLKSCAERIAALSPKVVGISSIFQSHVAALGIAMQVKRLNPDTKVIVGGSNCDGIMGIETARQFSFLDAVCVGEGDEVFPLFVENVLAGLPVDTIQGIYTHITAKKAKLVEIARPIENMDELPFPDFDDHFTSIGEFPEVFEAIRKPHLMFETARGCWWGERMHCTFCGLNGSTMKFRSKSPERALKELLHLRQKYPKVPVAVSDNILDMKYLTTFLAKTAELADKPSMFYEVKANLRRIDIERLKRGGVDRVQPGIESFSTHCLKLMRKGVTAVQNIQTLKWCAELDVEVVWGFLWGFPGERAADYLETIALVRKLHHLPPPSGLSRIRLDRFSPNFNAADQIGFTNIRPFPSYSHVYPRLPKDAIEKIAYFYDYDSPTDSFGHLGDALRVAVNEWRDRHLSGLFTHLVTDRYLVCFDFRTDENGVTHVFEGLERALIIFCEKSRTLQEVETFHRTLLGNSPDQNDLTKAFSLLQRLNILLVLDRKYLTLSCRLGEFEIDRRLSQRIEKHGQLLAA